RQYEDRGRHDLPWEGQAVQSAFPANVLAPSGRTRRLHASVRLGEGPGREPGRSCARTLLLATLAVQDLRRVERLAYGQVHRLRQGARPSGAAGHNDLGGVRDGAP